MKGTGMRPSINQSCFPDIGTREFTAVASAAGFRSVELRILGRDEPLSLIREAVEDSGPRVEAINGIMDWALPDDPDPHPALERALQVAMAVHAPMIVCAAPIRQGPLPPRDTVLQSATERLAGMAEVARPAGVALVLEQVGQSSTRPGAVSGIAKLNDALAVAEGAGEDVLVALDSYNLTTAGESLTAVGRVPLYKVGIAQLAGSGAAPGQRGLLDEGNIDNRGFLRTLAQMGYTGGVSLETFPPVPWDDPAEIARRSFAQLEALINEATGQR